MPLVLPVMRIVFAILRPGLEELKCAMKIDNTADFPAQKCISFKRIPMVM
jgi:hypothetical protein